MTVIEFPKYRSGRAEPREIQSFTDLVPTDDALDARAAELLPEALATMRKFPPAAVAEMLAFAAARLERAGFVMFQQ